MKILLSIKPKYVNQIISGEKKFEFRRTMYKQQDIRRIVVYSSKPVGKIVGEIEVGQVLCENPSVIWEMTSKFSGLEKDVFFDYFKGKEKANAIQIKRFIPYDTPVDLNSVYPGASAPQSFCYVEN